MKEKQCNFYNDWIGGCSLGPEATLPMVRGKRIGGKTVRVSWKVTISSKYQFVPRTIVVRWMPLPTGNKENFCTKYTAYHPLEKSVAIVRRCFFQPLLWDSIPSILAPIFKEILLLTSRVSVHPEFSFQPRFLFEPISVD